MKTNADFGVRNAESGEGKKKGKLGQTHASWGNKKKARKQQGLAQRAARRMQRRARR
jgi:hypothetical protein